MHRGAERDGTDRVPVLDVRALELDAHEILEHPPLDVAEVCRLSGRFQHNAYGYAHGRFYVEHETERKGPTMPEPGIPTETEPAARVLDELDEPVRTARTAFAVVVTVEHDARSRAEAIALELERTIALAQPGWRGLDGRDRRAIFATVTASERA
jgi:hypothetical protein